VPAQPPEHDVDGTFVFDLEHRAFAGLVDAVARFRHHAIEARAFEPLEPIGGDGAVARYRCEVEGWAGVREHLLEPRAAGGEGLRAQIHVAFAEEIPEH